MLFRTGDQSRDFAVVLATNRPADLDAAVIDRMDEAIEFPLPGPSERTQILKMYIDSYIAKAGTLEGKAASYNHFKLWAADFFLAEAAICFASVPLWVHLLTALTACSTADPPLHVTFGISKSKLLILRHPQNINDSSQDKMHCSCTPCGHALRGNSICS